MPQPTSEHYLLCYTSDRCLRFSKSPLPHTLRPEAVGGERGPPNIYHLGAVGMGMEHGGISPGYIIYHLSKVGDRTGSMSPPTNTGIEII